MKKIRTYVWFRLALYSSHHKYQEKKELVGQMLRKRKIYDGDELQVDLLD
jgi:hypothetical protein